jgi:hypothetical protein
LDKSFAGLYDTGVEQDSNPFGSSKGGSRFIEVYGWHYTIYEIAKLNNQAVNEVWDMKTLEYLNTMAYIKALRDYQK